MLPDLGSNVDVDIVADNLRAVQAIYFASQLEELRMFEVVERLVERFQQGLLPVGRGRRLLKDFAASRDRLSRQERRALYSRALGAPGASHDDPQPNREFPDLFLRLLASIALFERQQGAAVRARASAWRAARALAANATVHGAGLCDAVRRLSADANRMRAILEAPDIRRAYGARDMWQVIDQVAARELGGAVNVVRHRTLAHAGSAILQWLAEHADALSKPAAAGADATIEDPALLHAVDRWLGMARPGESAGPAGASLALQAMVLGLLRLLGLPDASAQGRLALFCGAAGTGKTIAAHAVAAALARDLVRVDLRQIVSRYIGETEKNLTVVLADAERIGAVLLLDEADALFGRRTGVQDAHDRYAALDRASFLQRLRAHPGIVIVECELLPEPTDAGAAAPGQVVRFPHRP